MKWLPTKGKPRSLTLQLGIKKTEEAVTHTSTKS